MWRLQSHTTRISTECVKRNPEDLMALEGRFAGYKAVWEAYTEKTAEYLRQEVRDDIRNAITKEVNESVHYSSRTYPLALILLHF